MPSSVRAPGVDGVDDLALADLFAAADRCGRSGILRGEPDLLLDRQRGEPTRLRMRGSKPALGDFEPLVLRMATIRSAIAGAAVRPGDWMPAQLISPCGRASMMKSSPSGRGAGRRIRRYSHAR